MVGTPVVMRSFTTFVGSLVVVAERTPKADPVTRTEMRAPRSASVTVYRFQNTPSIGSPSRSHSWRACLSVESTARGLPSDAPEEQA